MIHLLFTGGTISMQRDPSAGGNLPAHGGEELVEFTQGLERISPYRIEDWARVPAGHLGPHRLWELRQRVLEITETGEVRGIVVTHGTDILEESAYLLDRTLPRTIPVAMTGAMRTSSDSGWDGPENLRSAAAVAADPGSTGLGVVVVFHGKVFAGTAAVKVHATDPDAFDSPHAHPLARVENGTVIYEREPQRGAAASSSPSEFAELNARVALVPVVVGDQGELLDLARPAHDGVVVVGFGSGNVPPGAVPAIGRWLDEGKPVVLASRCHWGQVTPMYAFEGGGSRLVAMGAIPAGPRTPSQARMELMIAISAGQAYGS
jgi:L-asparaginase